jgi:hypothetical protein
MIKLFTEFTAQNKLDSLKKLKVLMVGIGNCLRMDDAIGVIVAEKLTEHLKLNNSALRQLSVYCGGLTSEDCINVVKWLRLVLGAGFGTGLGGRGGGDWVF